MELETREHLYELEKTAHKQQQQKNHHTPSCLNEHQQDRIERHTSKTTETVAWKVKYSMFGLQLTTQIVNQELLGLYSCKNDFGWHSCVKFSLPWHLSEALRDFVTLTKFQVDQFFGHMGEILLSHRSKNLRDHSHNQSNRGKGGYPLWLRTFDTRGYRNGSHVEWFVKTSRTFFFSSVNDVLSAVH